LKEIAKLYLENTLVGVFEAARVDDVKMAYHYIITNKPSL
jgi:hypothetical protein